jgi:hypothetical protein
MEDNVSAARLAARRDVAQKSIATLRKRLLDLSNYNRLLNFKFSDRSRTHVRIIDELPDVLYRKLVDDGKRLTFTALPEPKDEPQDEKSEEFLAALQGSTRKR